MSEGDAIERQTTVEEGTEIEGTLTSSCPIIVRGKIKGELLGPALTVSPTGAVSGKVAVETIHSEGELAGEYDAQQVKLSGRVRDQTVIRAASLEVRLTPQAGRMELVFGECELEIGDAPSKEAAVAAALHGEIAPRPPSETMVAAIADAKAESVEADEAKADEAKADEAKADEAKADAPTSEATEADESEVSKRAEDPGATAADDDTENAAASASDDGSDAGRKTGRRDKSGKGRSRRDERRGSMPPPG